MAWLHYFFMNSYWPMLIAAFLYIGQAIAYTKAGNTGMALAFYAYAVANIGFVIQFLNMR